MVAAFSDPAVKEAMAKRAAFRRELAKYAALVKKVGLEPQ